MRLLNLCSGTGSVSLPFVAADWEVVEVDWDPHYGPTHVIDLTVWNCPYEAGFFDVVWASPDCTQYSRARTTAKTPRDLDTADKLVQRCFELIFQLKPRFWFVENPDSGLLKTRPFMQGLPFVRVGYCMYGALYRKRTRIWTNATWAPQTCDRSHLVGRRHPKTAQRGGRGTWDPHDSCERDELHALPARLCKEIFNVCHSPQHIVGPSSESESETLYV